MTNAGPKQAFRCLDLITKVNTRHLASGNISQNMAHDLSWARHVEKRKRWKRRVKGNELVLKYLLKSEHPCALMSPNISSH